MLDRSAFQTVEFATVLYARMDRVQCVLGDGVLRMLVFDEILKRNGVK